MISVQPSHRAPAQQVHGNSMHPKVRAVLERGLGTEWTSADVQDLLGLSDRAAHYLFSSGMLHITRYPSKNTTKTIRRTTGLSLLFYLIQNSDEITEDDAQPIIKKVLPLLTNQILEGVVGACKALISARSSLLMAVKPNEAPAAAKPAPTPAPKSAAAAASNAPLMQQAELFPAHETGAPQNHTTTTTP